MVLFYFLHSPSIYRLLYFLYLVLKRSCLFYHRDKSCQLIALLVQATSISCSSTLQNAVYIKQEKDYWPISFSRFNCCWTVLKKAEATVAGCISPQWRCEGWVMRHGLLHGTSPALSNQEETCPTALLDSMPTFQCLTSTLKHLIGLDGVFCSIAPIVRRQCRASVYQGSMCQFTVLVSCPICSRIKPAIISTSTLLLYSVYSEWPYMQHSGCSIADYVICWAQWAGTAILFSYLLMVMKRLAFCSKEAI